MIASRRPVRLGLASRLAPAPISSPPIVSPLRLNEDDADLCKRMTVEAGVTAVPMWAFYDSDGPRHFVRFWFSKRDEVLDDAIARLSKWLGERRASA